MEILKKLVLSATVILLSGQLYAQTGSAAMQKAFKNSYANESKKSYSSAMSDIMPFYADNNYEVNLRLGWLNFLNKNYTSAQSYYQKAVGLRPNSIEAKFGYIKPLSLLESWDKVLGQYNDILKLDPQNTQANYWTGYIYYNRKQYDAAIKCFSKVVSLYPFDYDGNQMLGWAHLMSGKKAEARACFERGLLIKPDDASCTDGLNRSK
ncbi:tetratricopeptide repeat protein [Mucilaginibacter myungsuensis]|uniref:Tetratricopeptide repeat protein n=1 Tax=Mucilaginibacter myungsuensis TaxID=649104 RepID=A0A929PZL6_9SPHI|nr:tetratricopeptide repeat protein [Mucilaginibacter myungsuensis]MBE9664625.1 tetratricopeptide repeat protein [Mucilaginibacter myungsuensis]MDN3601485.1 tetratricopeptide repeat protein [Mucilaginibacter myungsuensis]